MHRPRSGRDSGRLHGVGMVAGGSADPVIGAFRLEQPRLRPVGPDVAGEREVGHASILPAASRAGEDADPAETAEWCEALDALTAAHGPKRARFVLDALLAHARRRRGDDPQGRSTENWSMSADVPRMFSWPANVFVNFQPRPATAPGENPL